MRTPLPPTDPQRLENGAIDLDFYLRRAHRLRAQDACQRLQRGARFFTATRRHDG